ncbi:hypothetical protein R20233_01439 [Ralstonia sp. LMG 32965]|nr:hypothetical protein R20233_01439 [Ralstonia sp. LMG 32965]
MLANLVNRTPAWVMIAIILVLIGYGYISDQFARVRWCESFNKHYGLHGKCVNAFSGWSDASSGQQRQ